MEERSVKEKILVGSILVQYIPRLIGSIVAVLIGLFMVIVSSISFIKGSNYIETVATIKDIKYDNDIEEYVPIYEYNFNDRIVEVEGIPEDNKNDIKIGEEVTIFYNPNNYKEFNIGSHQSGFIILIIGCLFTVCGGLFVYRYIKSIIDYKKGNININIYNNEEII